MKKKNPFSPFDIPKRKKPFRDKRKKALTRKALKHLYNAALENDELVNAEIKSGDFEKF